jgi:hypothetical protein
MDDDRVHSSSPTFFERGRPFSLKECCQSIVA